MRKVLHKEPQSTQTGLCRCKCRWAAAAGILFVASWNYCRGGSTLDLRSSHDWLAKWELEDKASSFSQARQPKVELRSHGQAAEHSGCKEEVVFFGGSPQRSRASRRQRWNRECSSILWSCMAQLQARCAIFCREMPGMRMFLPVALSNQNSPISHICGSIHIPCIYMKKNPASIHYYMFWFGAGLPFDIAR